MHLKIQCECPAPFFCHLSDAKNQDKGRDRQIENANLYSQYKSPEYAEYKEPSNAKAYEFPFVFLRFWISFNTALFLM